MFLRIKSKVIALFRKYNCRKHFSSISGTFFLFIIFFSYGVYHNLSFSYMGNTSEKMVQFIIDNFLWDIVKFISRLFSVYFIIALLFGIFIHLVLISLEQLFKIKINNLKLFIYNFVLSLCLYLPFFLYNLVKYPQVFINGFYSKSSIISSFVDSLADSVTPIIFFSVFLFLLIMYLSIIIIRFIKINNKKYKYFAFSFVTIIFLIVIFSKISFSSLSYAQNKKNKNVLILASDALRPDHLSKNGYFRKTSPNIDKLIDGGISFQDAHVEVPRTFPSWVSTLTGQFASTHGIRHMFPTSRDINRDFVSIVKELDKKGYYTAAVADYAGDIFSRVELGFNKVDTPFFNTNSVLNQAILDTHVFLMPFLLNSIGLETFPVLKDSAYFCPPKLVERRVIETIKESGDKPFFITTFFSSTHFPYAPPYPYYKMFSKEKYNGPYKYLKQKIIALNGDAVREKISDSDKEQVNALYDGGIRALDDSVGNILNFLKENSLIDNTIIILLADHGENLYEDQLGMGHGEHFRGQLATRIPFVIYDKDKNFKSDKSKIKKVVRQVDIAPTILDLLGIDIPREMEGESLKPIIEGKKLKSKRYAYGETGIWFDNAPDPTLFFQQKRIIYPDITSLAFVDFNFRRQMVLSDDYRDVINLAKHRYIYDGRYKLIYMPLVNRVEYELYDVLNDPFCTKNIKNVKPAIYKKLKDQLFKWIKRNNDVIIKDDFVFPVTRY